MGRDERGADRPTRFRIVKHVPHMVVAAPWEDDELTLSIGQWRHLGKVLRLNRGDRISYTDGLGRVGEGRLGNQSVVRGEEHDVPRGRELTIAAPPPQSKDRQRFLVEKLAELGVMRLRWLRTTHGEGRPASAAKVFAWVLSAVEQSRGAWLMEIDQEMAAWHDLEAPIAVCEQGGEPRPIHARTVVVGPEGGFAPDELPEGSLRWDLGRNVLRLETAAVVAAARFLSD